MILCPRRSATSPTDDPLVDGFVTADVDGTRFGIEGKSTEYRRGGLRIWIASGIPAAEAGAIARRVRERGAFAMRLEPDRSSGVVRAHQFVNRIADRIAQEGMPLATSKLTARQALDDRRRELTRTADHRLQVLREGDVDTQDAQRNRPAAVERDLFGHPPITHVSLAILEVPDTVALQLAIEEDDDTRPNSVWHDRYGARLVGDNLTVEISRPPRTLADAQRAALELFLMCPAHPDGYETHASAPKS